MVKNQGGSEDPKTLAKSMLEEGADIEAIVAETSLSKPTVLGLKGSLIKAQKRLATEAKAPSQNLEEETDLNTDLKKEAQTTNNMVVLARGKQRLKSLDPVAYRDHYGPPEQAETSPGKVMADLELSRYIRTLRENESHPNNGDSSQAMLELQRQITDLKTEMHKKDIENLTKQTDDLKQEVKELRSDVRGSVGVQSDLAVIVRETSSLLEKVISHDGPLRSYLSPDVPIQPRGAAPLLRAQPAEAQNGLVDVLRSHGLTTRVIERQPT